MRVGGTAALAMLLIAQPGGASGPASLSLAPVLIELPQGQQGATVRLGNGGDRPVPVQLRLFAWEQPDGTAENFAPAKDVAVSPSIVEVGARTTQILRVVRTAPSLGQGERPYRLVIDQLPDKTLPTESGAIIRLRMVAPVFLDTPKGARPALAWQADRGRFGVTNRGNRRAQISTVSLVTADGRATEIKNAAPAYVLAGNRRDWALPAGICVPAGARLVATVDEVATNVAVPATC